MIGSWRAFKAWSCSRIHSMFDAVLIELLGDDSKNLLVHGVIYISNIPEIRLTAALRPLASTHEAR